jgi:nucleolar protein 9
MKSVFAPEDQGEQKKAHSTPTAFRETAHKLVQVVRDELDENEVRALATSKVASPVLQVRFFLTFERRTLNRTNRFF